MTDERKEIDEIRAEIKDVKEHSETWELLKFQSEQSGKERFRQWVTIIVLIILLVVSNLAWLYAWFQYDYVDYTVSADQDGTGLNIVGGRDIDYGAESQDSYTDTD